MVVLVAAGALLGPDALDALDLPLDSIGVQLLLTLGVSMILFHGGLGLSFAVLRPVALGLGLLAIPGVVITAVVTGAVAAVAFDLPLEAGLLIGAVLAPTDPAILIPLFERLRVRAKVTQTIIAESALNDVTGAVLTLALASFVIEGEGSLTSRSGSSSSTSRCRPAWESPSGSPSPSPSRRGGSGSRASPRSSPSSWS